MKITIEIDVTDHYSVSLAEFMEKTVQLRNKRWTNSYRQKAQHPGCYAFYMGNECLYIGKSINAVGQRILEHVRSSWTPHDVDPVLRRYSEEDLQLTFWLCEKEDVGMLEHYLIKTLKPTLNTRGRTGERMKNLTLDDLYGKEEAERRMYACAQALELAIAKGYVAGNIDDSSNNSNEEWFELQARALAGESIAAKF